MDERRCAPQSRNDKARVDSPSDESPITKTYLVPQRFGVGTIMLGTALFGLLFAVMKWLDAPVPLIVAVASFLSCVALGQVIFQRAPRLASAVIGAIFHPALAVAYIATDPVVDPSGVVAAVVGYAIFGALVGYITGGLIAGVFLVSDYILRTMARLRSRGNGAK